jgi:hypothetical protein
MMKSYESLFSIGTGQRVHYIEAEEYTEVWNFYFLPLSDHTSNIVTDRKRRSIAGYDEPLSRNVALELKLMSHGSHFCCEGSIGCCGL